MKQMERLHQLQQPETGHKSVADRTVDSVIYAIEPAQIQGKTQGIFMVAYITADERCCNCVLEHKAFGIVRIDRQRITQAVINLVNNANKHTPIHGVIALGSELTHNSVRFWVRDTGKGIDPTDQERIFERFAQATKGLYRSEGTGLGFAIVQAIVTTAGGKVQLESQLGCGSTFSLVLPRVLPQ
jgi:signal transduction histidine kinase